MKPVCVPCQRFFRCIKTGFYFTEGMPETASVLPGIEQANRWRPYKIWAGDKWKCEGCGAEILSGFGSTPIAIHHEPDFNFVRDRFGAHYQVNDC